MTGGGRDAAGLEVEVDSGFDDAAVVAVEFEAPVFEIAYPEVAVTGSESDLFVEGELDSEENLADGRGVAE